MTKTLLLTLDAPMQSYGKPQAFNERRSFAFPSKRAILGLLGAAFGLERDSSYFKVLDDNLDFSVRIDQAGKFETDYQTVNYGKASKITYRQYLADSVFLVALSSDNLELLNAINDALKHPRYALYLGRRAYPIGGILKTNLVDGSGLNVLMQYPWQAKNFYKHKNFTKQSFNLPIIVTDKSSNRLVDDSYNYNNYVKPGRFQNKKRPIKVIYTNVDNDEYIGFDDDPLDIFTSI